MTEVYSNTLLNYLSPDSLNEFGKNLIGEKRIFCPNEIYEIITNDLQLKEKEIFLDYYVNDRKMHEIANDHNVHESRISQILKKVIQKINMKWSGNRSELYDIAA